MSTPASMFDSASIKAIEESAASVAEQIRLHERKLDQDWIKGVDERAALVAERMRAPEPFGLDSASIKAIEEKAARFVEQIRLNERKLGQDWIKSVDERAALLAARMRAPDRVLLAEPPVAPEQREAPSSLPEASRAGRSVAAPRRKAPRRSSPKGEVERASVVRVDVPTERPKSHRGAFLTGGQLVLDLRGASVGFLRSAGLHDALEELAAIEERLATGGRVPIKHAADSTRRVIRAVADHVFPPSGQPYVDRWRELRSVDAPKPVNRIMAFVDSGLMMQSEEQRALAAELSALWRSVSDDVHSVKSVREARYDYVRLLRMLAAVGRSLAG